MAVSPMMRPIPSTMPLAMPGRTDGSSTQRNVVMRVLPSAKEASRMRPGTWARDSRVEPKTSGSARIAMMIPAAKKDCPVTVPFSACCERKPRNGRANSSRPKIASTMLGTPASVSIADSTARASHEGRPYSDSHAASATPSGAAIPIPTAVTMNVPISGSRKPPAWPSLSEGAGDSVKRLGVR